MKVAMAQINVTVGGIDGNIEKIKEYLDLAGEHNASIVAFPELAVTGYPPQDLLYDREFVKTNKESLLRLMEENVEKEIVGIIGFVDYEGEILYNAAAVFNGNKLAAVVHKTLLPTYDVFDEARYFKPSKDINPVKVNVHGEEINIGVEICEDLWDEGYHVKVTDTLAAKGADLIINLSASPFYVGKNLLE